jgi:2-dehydro-3-deoxygluconokinase
MTSPASARPDGRILLPSLTGQGAVSAMTPPLRVALIGECMIELKEGPAGDLSRSFGGDTFNTAAYMARLGAALGPFVDYVSAVGDDRFSEDMLAFWAAHGVGSRLTLALPGRRPGLYAITVDKSGERSFAYWRGEAAARDCFAADGSDAVLAALAEYDLIYLSGISLAVLRPPSRERLLSRIEELAAAGVAVAFDCNHRPTLWADAAETRAAWQRVFGFARFVLMTVEEAAVLALGALDPLALMASWPGIELVVKDGAEPCIIRSGGRIFRVPATRVERLVDTTAAGDSFSAAYLLGRLLGLSVEECARSAHAVAGAVVQHPGAIAPAGAVPDVFAERISHPCTVGAAT